MARFGSWGSVIAACAMVMACTPASEGFGDGSATQLGGGDSTGGGMTSTQSADGLTSSAEGNGSGGASQGDSTSISTSSGVSDSDSDSDSDSEGDGPEPMAEEEELGRANFAGCDDPLWCYFGGNVNNPAGGATWAQECFRADMEPPFELVEFEAVIRGMSFELTTIELQIYERSGSGGPMDDEEPIVSRMIPREDLVIGVNTITIDPPIELERQRFCIGLAAPENGPYGSLGVSVDPGSQVDGVSYYRIEGDGACWLPDWTDVIDDQPNPNGNWCVRATVREL